MSRQLIVLRPEPGLSETLALARAKGLETIAAPLFHIEPVTWQAPDPANFDAILAGSANAFRRDGATLMSLSSLPVHAVGERTARAAADAGFSVASVGAGGLQQVLDRLLPGTRLLRLAGERHVPLEVPDGSTVAELIVYRAQPACLSQEAARALQRDAVALLHSGEAATQFARECERIGIDRARVSLAVLAPRIADAAGNGWRAVAVAAHPTDAALLAIAADMCQ